jgi:gliding motility-associated-like protein
LIPSDDSVLIRLIAISKYGCKPDTLDHWFFTRHKPRPNFTFTYNPISGCGPNLVTFNNTTPYQNWFTYQWDFGNPPNIQTPAPSPRNSTNAQPGTVLFQSDQFNFIDAIYNVHLTVTNVCETKDTILPVVIKSLPKAQFAPNQTNVCSNTLVTFTNTTLGLGVTYNWNFGDGTIINSANNNPVQHTYNVGDTTTFYVVLTATNSCGVDVDSVAIRVTPSTIDLNWFILQNTQFGCAPHQVEIHNISTGGTQFEWNYNDPNSPLNYISNLNNEVIYHTYTTPGIYNISVHATNVCSDTTGIKTVRVIRSPIPAFQIVNNNDCPWTPISFLNLTDTATNYTWNFGDPASGLNNTSNSLNPSHIYSAPGVYTVTLSASLVDISGIICTQILTHNVNVIAPIAQINTVSSGCINDTILFTPVVSSVLGLAPIQDTIWQINGVPYTVPAEQFPNFSHVFTVPGTYTISLIVGTIYGCYDTVSTNITINGLPTITVSADQRICLGQSVQLNANSNAGNYQWTPLAGLSCYNCSNPIASPTTSTNYVVSTFNTFGCKSSDTIAVTVIQPFDITVSANDTICIGESTTLTVSGASNYAWTPAASLSCNNCPNPIANPQITTLYTVVGSDNYRCFTDTGKVLVAVGQYPVVTLPAPQVLSTGTLYPIVAQITNGPIRNYLWTPSRDLSCDNCSTPVAFIRNDICYSLEAENIYGCKGSDTFCIRVFCENTQVFIPNTFTPDNDGINDVFMVRGTGIKSVKQFRVFNRWGELIFERSNFAPNARQFGWDGKIRGVLATPDVFVYTAEVLCENDVPFIYKGNVTLIR